jgi:hypothetical protein
MIGVEVLLGILALLAILALAGWGATLVHISRSLLPNAQAYQAMAKVSFEMDERIRNVLASFEKRNQAQISPTLPDQLDEVRRRAQSMGFSINANGNVSERQRPMTPPPEPPEIDLTPGFVE